MNIKDRFVNEKTLEATVSLHDFSSEKQHRKKNENV